MLTFWSTIQMHTFVSVIFHILSFGLLSLHCQCVMDQMQLKIKPSRSFSVVKNHFTIIFIPYNPYIVIAIIFIIKANCAIKIAFFAFCKQLLGTNIIIRERGHFCKSICSSFAFEIEKKIWVHNLVLESSIWNGQFLFMVLCRMMLLCNRPKKAYFLQFGFRTSDLCHSMSFPGTIAGPVCPSSSL